MQEVNKLKVLYQGRLVGTLVKYDRYRTVFAYDKEWLADGFAISPFSLPLSGKPFVANLEASLVFLLIACQMVGGGFW